MPTTGPSVEDVSLPPEHREAVHRNGVVEIGPFHQTINQDFVRVYVQRTPLMHELVANFRVLQEVRTLHKRLYVLVVVDRQTAPPSAAQRRLVADWEREHGATAIAMVAPGNPLFVITMKLVFRALNLFQSKPRPSAFFATEAEAKVWLDAQRSYT